jgi:type IV secretory pathway TraG/TraD family ATPase VirD4
MACIRIKAVFNPGDAETAERMAEEIGQQTLERREVADTHSSERSSCSISWRREEGFAVSPEQLRRLPNLSAYLKLGGDFAVAKIVIHRKKS